jgi:hypothetical protein
VVLCCSRGQAARQKMAALIDAGAISIIFCTGMGLNIRDRHGAGAYIQNVSLLAPFFETCRLL